MGILALLLTIALGTAGTAPPLAARSSAELPEISHALPAESAAIATAAPRSVAPWLAPHISGKYFGARYFSSQQGRFMSPDPLLNLRPTIANPQRWNRYAYVSNNPLNRVDPDGRDEYLLVWTNTADRYGHAAMAVQDRDSSGKATGTLTVRSLWPGGAVKKQQAPYAEAADYRTEKARESNLGSIRAGELTGPSAIVRIKGDARQDATVTAELDKQSRNPQYVPSEDPAIANTCATFAKVGVEAAGIPVNQTGTVTAGGLVMAEHATTPASVYNSVVDSGDSRVEVVQPLPQDQRDPNLRVPR